MIGTAIIVHPEAASARSLTTQVAAISRELVVLESDSYADMELLVEEYGCTLLLIDSRCCPALNSLSKLPEESAILILQESDTADIYLENPELLFRNYDILTFPASPALVEHTIQQLLKQQTTSKELFTARKKIHELTKIILNNDQALYTQQRYMDILAERDGLTGLYNRKYLSSILRKEFKRARRYQTDLSLLLLDIDHFKDINMILGHLFGDFILNEMAARLTANTRDSDLCFRFGGGNFIVLLPEANIDHAAKVAKKLNGCCSDKTFDNGTKSRNVTISIGIASMRDSSPVSPEQLIHMADRAMYLAKAKGRNRYQQYQQSAKDVPQKQSH